MITPSFSIGIEEEYQIIDPKTRELRSYISELLEEGKLTLREQVKAELHPVIKQLADDVTLITARLAKLEAAATSIKPVQTEPSAAGAAGTLNQREQVALTAALSHHPRGKSGLADEIGMAPLV